MLPSWAAANGRRDEMGLEREGGTRGTTTAAWQAHRHEGVGLRRLGARARLAAQLHQNVS